jgi:hypothetical protein
MLSWGVRSQSRFGLEDGDVTDHYSIRNPIRNRLQKAMPTGLHCPTFVHCLRNKSAGGRRRSPPWEMAICYKFCGCNRFQPLARLLIRSVVLRLRSGGCDSELPSSAGGAHRFSAIRRQAE